MKRSNIDEKLINYGFRQAKIKAARIALEEAIDEDRAETQQDFGIVNGDVLDLAALVRLIARIKS